RGALRASQSPRMDRGTARGSTRGGAKGADLSAQQLRSRRHHPMPFGAEALPDGRVRFRLWAPDAERVELAIELPPSGEMVPLTMAAEQEGWHGAITDRASPGTLYRYRIEGGAEVPDPASRYQPF